MQTPTEDTVYEDEFTGDRVVCVSSPDTFGVPTHKAENMQIEFETVEDGEWFTIPVDNFRGNYTKVADSVDKLEAQPSDEEIQAEIRDRANESWARLASEFGMTEDDVRSIIVGDA